MEEKEFQEIIDFAIRREYEAAKFYKELKEKVKIPESKRMLEELEQMEHAHAEQLKKITAADTKGEYLIPEVPDLKLSDYLVNQNDTEFETLQDILLVAMKREDAAATLYNKLAEQSKDPNTKNLFLKLFTEEKKHKLQLETIYDDEIYTEN
ncbi:MAG: ferritin family protein [Bacteroidota bacterium]